MAIHIFDDHDVLLLFGGQAIFTLTATITSIHNDHLDFSEQAEKSDVSVKKYVETSKALELPLSLAKLSPNDGDMTARLQCAGAFVMFLGS